MPALFRLDMLGNVAQMFSPPEWRGNMIGLSDNERRRAFSTWLRTGRLPSVESIDGIELKFNPWHDPQTGRFTFAGAGRHYGQWPGKPGEATRTAAPTSRAAPSKTFPHRQRTWTGGGFGGGGGGSFGGAGASGTWKSPEPKSAPNSPPNSTIAVVTRVRGAATSNASAGSASSAGEQFRTVVRNGYTYQIDTHGRTRHVSGVLTSATVPVRSRRSQLQAGGTERRASDDGGHYIAARFNGPREAFNHFAQDANFNRGRYRMLEEEWAREKRAGRRVIVKIVPRLRGEGVRPTDINVWWAVDGNVKSIKFPNERAERSSGK